MENRPIPVKTDLFGRKMKEKFPYYPYGTIIPGCKGSRRQQVTRWPKSSLPSKDLCAPPSQPHPSPANTNTGRSTASSSRRTHADKNVPSTSQNLAADSIRVCKKMAKLIQDELPACRLDPELLEEIQLKCEMYWKALLKNKIFLDEDAVMLELRAKLRSWAGQTHQVELDEKYSDDDQEEEENTYRQLIEFPQDNDFLNPDNDNRYS